MTKLEMWGLPVRLFGDFNYETDDSDGPVRQSIEKYNQRTYPMPPAFISDLVSDLESDEAALIGGQAFVDALMSRFLEPVETAYITFNPWASGYAINAAVSARVGDRVSLRSGSQLSGGIYFIESIGGDLTPERPRMTWGISKRDTLLARVGNASVRGRLLRRRLGRRSDPHRRDRGRHVGRRRTPALGPYQRLRRFPRPGKRANPCSASTSGGRIYRVWVINEFRGTVAQVLAATIRAKTGDTLRVQARESAASRRITVGLHFGL